MSFYWFYFAVQNALPLHYMTDKIRIPGAWIMRIWNDESGLFIEKTYTQDVFDPADAAKLINEILSMNANYHPEEVYA